MTAFPTLSLGKKYPAGNTSIIAPPERLLATFIYFTTILYLPCEVGLYLLLNRVAGHVVDGSDFERDCVFDAFWPGPRSLVQRGDGECCLPVTRVILLQYSSIGQKHHAGAKGSGGSRGAGEPSSPKPSAILILLLLLYNNNK